MLPSLANLSVRSSSIGTPTSAQQPSQPLLSQLEVYSLQHLETRPSLNGVGVRVKKRMF